MTILIEAHDVYLWVVDQEPLAVKWTNPIRLLLDGRHGSPDIFSHPLTLACFGFGLDLSGQFLPRLIDVSWDGLFVRRLQIKPKDSVFVVRRSFLWAKLFELLCRKGRVRQVASPTMRSVQRTV